MIYYVETVGGKKIDMAYYVPQMVANVRQKKMAREQTPIGVAEDGHYFWWDEEKNPTLNGVTVATLVRKVKALAKAEYKRNGAGDIYRKVGQKVETFYRGRWTFATVDRPHISKGLEVWNNSPVLKPITQAEAESKTTP